MDSQICPSIFALHLFKIAVLLPLPLSKPLRHFPLSHSQLLISLLASWRAQQQPEDNHLILQPPNLPANLHSHLVLCLPCPCSHPKPAPALIQVLPLHMSTGLHPFSLIQGLSPCSCVLSLICLSPLSVESFLSSSMHAALPPNFKILSHSPRSPYRYYLISQLLSIAIPPKGCWMIASLSSPPLSLPPIPVSLCPHHCTGYSSQGH